MAAAVGSRDGALPLVARLDSFRKAADARIDTLYAHETDIPPHIWKRFCCSSRIVLYASRDSFSSILPTLRSLPHRLRALGMADEAFTVRTSLLKDAHSWLLLP
jgi:hypothetical protein